MWKKISQFLQDEKNQRMLTLIGGGLAIVIGGLWSAFVYFFPAPEHKPNSEADCGSVAIGGDVSGTTITNNASAGIDCSSKER